MTVPTPPPRHSHKASGCINTGVRGEERPEANQSRWTMELLGVNFVLATAGFLFWTSAGSAAPMECHFDFRGEIPHLSTSKYIYLQYYPKSFSFWLLLLIPALCVFEGRHYSLGESWMDNACMQCTCLHPVGVGCCETWVHKQTARFGVQMPSYYSFNTMFGSCFIMMHTAAFL